MKTSAMWRAAVAMLALATGTVALAQEDLQADVLALKQ